MREEGLMGEMGRGVGSNGVGEEGLEELLQAEREQDLGAAPEGGGRGCKGLTSRPRSPEGMRREREVGRAACLQGLNPGAYGEAGDVGSGLTCLPKGLQCLVFFLRVSRSHIRLVSRQGAGAVLGQCGRWK